MVFPRLLAGILVGCFAQSTYVRAAEHFEENLITRPLRDGKVASRFSFTTVLEGASPRNPQTLTGDDNSQHYTLFPLALGQILREYAITELHLSLNAGKWNYDLWGPPDEPSVGTGAELWAWMGEGGPLSVDMRWQGLRNALAGLFCATLGTMDEQRTTSPSMTFTPEGSLPNWPLPHQIRHASLPSEHVCTENLTPFLKLLPCKSLSGIAALLNPHRLFDADWHGMGIHVVWGEAEGVKVRLTFQTVSDPLRNSWNNRRDWSLQSIFDRKIEQTCPVSESSEIQVVLPSDRPFSLTPEPSSASDKFHATYTVSGALNIEMKWPVETSFEYPTSEVTPLTPLSVQRTLRSVNQYRGALNVVVRNNLDNDIKTVYLETMPWLVNFFLHSLHIECNGSPRDDLISDVSYIPPIPHSRPTLFQSILTIPANSTIQLTMDITKSFLRYTEHPPDAQRGWDLPPAVFLPFTSDLRTLQRIYTPVLLVEVATPDFSMPYNVIIMSSTLVAFIFGSIFNLLTRRFVVVPTEGEEEASDCIEIGASDSTEKFDS